MQGNNILVPKSTKTKNLVDAMQEIALEPVLFKQSNKKSRFKSTGDLGLSKRQKAIIIGVLKGYKVRSLLRKNTELKILQK